MPKTSVVIVGGSLVGLSAALFLSWRGVETIVIDKHYGSAAHPRATGFTERTLEYFRATGIADRIPQVEPGVRLRRVKARSLFGEWLEETAWTPGEEGAFGDKASPCSGAAIAQDKLEPILRSAAQSYGADLHLGVEMISFDQSEGGVAVHVCARDSKEQYIIHADYMIAADGADSVVRNKLGIKRHGVGYLRTLRSVLFHCPDADAILARGVQQFQIDRPDFAAFLTSYGDGRWAMMLEDDRELSDREQMAAVHAALGRDVSIEIIATGSWDLAGWIADDYHQGRIFLAGDAAHQLPPTRGGFGANTGIDDAYNLSWKLKMVLTGQSKPELLDTYSEERQPVGWLRHQQTFARPDYARWTDDALRNEPLYDNEAMELGQLLRSTAVLGAGPELAPAARPSEWAGQAGTRAPHIWIEKHNIPSRLSTIDLFTHNYVLISSDRRWIAAAREAAVSLQVEIGTVHVGEDILLAEPGAFEEHFGIGADGASLVRPDGIIAWRTKSMMMNSSAVVQNVMKRVASLS